MIALSTRGKVVGEAMVGEEVQLVAQHQPPGEMEPYERLLYDASHGESTLFARQDNVEAAWRIVDGILDDVVPVHAYDPNSWGPTEAEDLIASDGGWYNPRLEGCG